MKDKIIDLNSMGTNIKKYRKQKNLTQEKLALLTDLSVQYIGNIERGNTTASIETIMKICYILEISPNQVLLSATETTSNALINQVLSMLSRKSVSFVKHIIAYINLLDNTTYKN